MKYLQKHALCVSNLLTGANYLKNSNSFSMLSTGYFSTETSSFLGVTFGRLVSTDLLAEVRLKCVDCFGYLGWLPWRSLHSERFSGFILISFETEENVSHKAKHKEH